MIPTNASCLIYNSFGTGTSRRFYKHVLPDVWWSDKKASNTIRMGTSAADSVSMLIDRLSDYVEPQEWSAQAQEEVKSLKRFTIQKGDVLIFGTPNAPDEFLSTVEISAHFGTERAHVINSVDVLRVPGGDIHHISVSGA